MPNSTISCMSHYGDERVRIASEKAKATAQAAVWHEIRAGELNPSDTNSVKKYFKIIYEREYFKNYAESAPVGRVIFVPTDNTTAWKYSNRHAVASFTRTNCLIMVHKSRITINRFQFPLNDEAKSLDTKEAFLGSWPGPLDRQEDAIYGKTSDYIRTLSRHENLRKLRYSNSQNDEQRRVILALLEQLLDRNGSLDASGITSLLVKPEETNIRRDDGDRKPLETLQKYLLSGKRSEAIMFAKSKNLWDHGACLSYLDRYQPQNKRASDGSIAKDEPLVQFYDDYINSLRQGILNTVYRSLWNRILPNSVGVSKRPYVGSNAYEFAILCANDCEMEFDESNELFKLIRALKGTQKNPGQSFAHLIALGLTTTDSYSSSDDLTDRSITSYEKNDTFASRTLTISNIDMLILNEIWEYCLNLAHKTTDPSRYDYIYDLIPYKLVFASRLLDMGLHSMFAYYLASIKNALIKMRTQHHVRRDEFYDWDHIERCVAHLEEIWYTYLCSPEFQNQGYERIVDVAPQAFEPLSEPQTASDSLFQSQVIPQQPSTMQQPQDIYDDQTMPTNQDQSWPSYQSDYQFQSPLSMDRSRGSGSGNGLTMRFDNIQPPRGREAPMSSEYPLSSIPEPLDEQPEPPPAFDTYQGPPQPVAAPLPAVHPYESDHSNYAAQEHPWQPQSYQADNEYPTSPPHMMQQESLDNGPTRYQPPTSSTSRNEPNSGELRSPRYSNASSIGGGVARDTNDGRAGRFSTSSTTGRESTAGGANNEVANSVPGKNGESQQSKLDDAQSSSILASFSGSLRAFLPKSNSKQMILPDDSKPTIVFDEERNTWIDTSKPEGENIQDMSAPPPVSAPVRPPASYAAPKSVKSRYPKAPMEP